MSTSLFSCAIYKKKHTNWAGFFLAMAIVCLVVVCVNAFIGERELPREIRGTTPYFVLGMALFTAPAIYIWVTKKIKLEIYKMGSTVCLDIADPEDPIQLKFPFKVHAQWFLVPAAKGPDQKELYLTFCDMQDTKLFSLKHTKGAFHSAPGNFTHVNLFGGTLKPIVAQRQFTCSKVEDIFNTLRAYKAA
jgi:hypothetical protein